MDSVIVKAYILKLPFNEPFTGLTEEDQEKFIFSSSEMLRRRFGSEIITDEMVALQTLYMAEGEGEEFAKFKRQGVKSMGLSGMSFSFDGGNVSPEVQVMIDLILNPPIPATKQRASIGRLV